MTDKTTIKTDIIRFIESKGHASKSQICDHLRDTKGTLGETTGRRMRELIEEGIIEKFKLETPFLQNPYFTYRVKPIEQYQLDEIQEDTTSMEEKLEAL